MEYIKLIESDRSKSYSTTYGINGRSLSQCLTYFDVTKCLPFDIMHTIFEGVANYHLQELLNHCIHVKKYFTLNQLNVRIKAHQYGYSERDTKPSCILFRESKYLIKQSG